MDVVSGSMEEDEVSLHSGVHLFSFRKSSRPVCLGSRMGKNSPGSKEGGAITASPGTVSLVNRAPHPNAAKVFINWFLSRNGQIAVQKLGHPSDPPNSRRVDIPKDELPSYNRRVEGTKYFDVSDPAFSDMKPILKLINETRLDNK